jgi:hypothetical protein
MRFCSNGRGRGRLSRKVGVDGGGEDSQEQAQKAPQSGEEETDVVSGADEDGVDGVAAGAGEAVAFEQAIGFRVADDQLDCSPSAQLALDGWRPLAWALRDVDFGRCEPVASVALVDIDPRDGFASEALDLGDLPAQRVAVIGQAGQRLDAERELAAGRARAPLPPARSTDPQIPIAAARVATSASPSRGFLPWRLSDAGPPTYVLANGSACENRSQDRTPVDRRH